MKTDNLPAHVERFLAKFKTVRPTRDGWVAHCPCADHNQDGDQNASLRITLGEDQRILINCRVGCKPDAVLEALGLDWADLFAAPGGDRASAEPAEAIAREDGDEKVVTDVRHCAYELLLKALPLSDDHRANLRQRGLNDEQIDRRCYRTLRNASRGKAAKAVHQELGDAVLNIPGFVKGAYSVTLHGDATGLLVPVRDLQGRIQALKVRRENDPKYVYLTGGDDGLSPGSPVHVPLGVQALASTVRVTEGELKSDVCVALDDLPTLGVPGVTQWKSALDLLKILGTKTVVLAFDSPDVHRKKPVLEQTEAFYRALLDSGYAVELEDWHDDLQRN